MTNNTTLSRIKLASRTQFALNGYDGASLATISNEVGIKKQSLYTYFKGKDELFLQVFADSQSQELEFVDRFFVSSARLPIETSLHGLLFNYLERFQEDDNTNFYLRTIFYPPVHLKTEIIQSGNSFIDELQLKIISLFENGQADASCRLAVDARTASAAYLALLDGMFVELIFGDLERAQARTKAAWEVYWRGIRI